jgi:hypothetical protein
VYVSVIREGRAPISVLTTIIQMTAAEDVATTGEVQMGD